MIQCEGDIADSLRIVKNVTRVFGYEEMFGGAPDERSDAAWEALYGFDWGVVEHRAGPGRKGTLAVFHQLRCLVGHRSLTCLPSFPLTISAKLITITRIRSVIATMPHTQTVPLPFQCNKSHPK